MSRFNPSMSLLASAAAITVAGMMFTTPANASTTKLPTIQPTPAPARTVPTTGQSAFDQHTNGWYDGLVNYLKPGQTGRDDDMALPGSDLMIAASKVGNQRNMRVLVQVIERIDPAHRVNVSPSAADVDAIRTKLLAHAAGIADHTFRKSGEFKLSFSKTGADTSAASVFFSLIRQAVETAKSEVQAN